MDSLLAGFLGSARWSAERAGRTVTDALAVDTDHRAYSIISSATGEDEASQKDIDGGRWSSAGANYFAGRIDAGALIAPEPSGSELGAVTKKRSSGQDASARGVSPIQRPDETSVAGIGRCRQWLILLEDAGLSKGKANYWHHCSIDGRYLQGGPSDGLLAGPQEASGSARSGSDQ